eukprot:TRINITY_DN5618_c0_g1_i1.p1 TRINITY_DN5618_c0_g1~~TRINITY_DN5618_c0_g1_i1.p1  ORF type:complete len:279 (+),score=24.27 TRINITY_DN5618_c0_g1_i1:388-1224(+)
MFPKTQAQASDSQESAWASSATFPAHLHLPLTIQPHNTTPPTITHTSISHFDQNFAPLRSPDEIGGEIIPLAAGTGINWSSSSSNYSRSSIECGMPSSIDIFEVAGSSISVNTSDDDATARPRTGPLGSFPGVSTPNEAIQFTPHVLMESSEPLAEEKAIPPPGPTKKVRRYNKRRKSVIFDSEYMNVASDEFQQTQSHSGSDQLSWTSYGESNPHEDTDNYTPLVWVEQMQPPNHVDLPAPAPAKEYTFVWEFPQDRKSPEPDRKTSASPQPRKSPQ